MGVPEEVATIRQSAALSRMDHVRCVCVRGGRAYEALDGLVTSDLRVRDGQMIHSLLLDEDGRIFADIHLGRDGEEFLILSEGPDSAELQAYLHRHLAASDAEFEDWSQARALIMINGPYAWELLALLLGGDVVGLPYLTLFHFNDGICFRTGKTGEYGYGILVPRESIESLWARLLEMGGALDVTVAGLDALDQCALENWYFNIRREGREAVTPVELQLQWRLSNRKPYAGSESVARRRQEGPRQRITCLVTEGPIAAGDAIVIDGSPVGRVVNAGHADILDRWVSLGLLDIRWAHSGIDVFRVRGAGAEVGARSMSPPLLNNRSLHVSPQIHSYATRHEFTFPPLPRK
jgi:glycine cleavage system aminomethyltransferase T